MKKKTTPVTEFEAMMLAHAGEGTTQLPSHNFFELDWHENDQVMA